MKICMLIYMFPPIVGGGEIGAFETAAAIAREGHEVHVLTSHYPGLKRYEEMQGVKVHRNIVGCFIDPYNAAEKASKQMSALSMVSFMKLAIPALLSLNNKERFDVIHSEFVLPAGVSGALVGSLQGTPSVVTLVGGDIFTPSEPFFMSFLRHLAMPLYKIAFTSKLTAISSDSAKRARSLGAHGKIDITPYGVDLSLFKKEKKNPELAKKLGLRKGPTIVSVCRLSKRKGLSYLLEAMSRLHSKFPDVNIILVGDGPERKRLEDLARRLNLDKNTIFTGAVEHDKLPDYYNLGDIFVLPSLHEGLGIVFMEAMACGLPVITTNKGGMVDIIEDEKTGFLIEPENSAQIEEQLLKLLRNESLRKRMSDSAQAKAINDFSWKSAAARYIKAYREAIKG